MGTTYPFEDDHDFIWSNQIKYDLCATCVNYFDSIHHVIT